MRQEKTYNRRPNPGKGAWFVYLLRCADGTLYTGITTNLERRGRQHNQGRASRYTRARLPVRLVYQEEQPTRSLALKREAALKALPRGAKLRLIREAALSARSGKGIVRLI